MAALRTLNYTFIKKKKQIYQKSTTTPTNKPPTTHSSQHCFDSDIDHMHHRRHHHHHHHHYIDEHSHHSDVHIDEHPPHRHLNNDDVDEIDEKLSEIIETVKHIEIGRVEAAPMSLQRSSVAMQALKEVKFTEPEVLLARVSPSPPAVVPQPTRKVQPPTHFHLSKQHTGMKNRSFNVGAAVSPTDKMEFDQERPESFGLLKINRPIGGLAGLHHTNKLSPHNDVMTSSPIANGEGMTDQGYFDLKFYHNKLW